MRKPTKSCSSIGRKEREAIEAQLNESRSVEAAIKKDLSVLTPKDKIPEPARRALSSLKPTVYADGPQYLEDLMQGSK